MLAVERPVSEAVSAPPPIEDLQWVYLGDKTVHFDWTNPRFRAIARGHPEAGESHDLLPVEYDIRFLPGRRIASDLDFLEARRIDFGWEGHRAGSYPVTGALLGKPNDQRCQFLVHMSENPETAQFRERMPGSYALRYRTAVYGWSPYSNVLFDEANAVWGWEDGCWTRQRFISWKVHDFDIRMLDSVGVSEVVAGGAVRLDIRDPFSAVVRPYVAVTVGLSAGLRFGTTRPRDQGWTRFRPSRHMHLWDFDDKGIRLVSQGIALKHGVGRSSLSIHESELDAHSNQRQIAGGIDFGGWGLTQGYEAKGLELVVGRLKSLADD